MGNWDIAVSRILTCVTVEQVCKLGRVGGKWLSKMP